MLCNRPITFSFLLPPLSLQLYHSELELSKLTVRYIIINVNSITSVKDKKEYFYWLLN